MTHATRFLALSAIACMGLLSACGGASSGASGSPSGTGMAATSASHLIPSMNAGTDRSGPIVRAASTTGSTTARAGVGLSAASPSSPNATFATTTWNAATFAGHGARGFNQPGDLSAKSFADMAATGANVVRVFVNMTLNTAQDAYLFDLTGVDAAVTAGLSDGFKVVIVFQPISQSTTPEFWSDSRLQASLVNNWSTTASKYRASPVVAAYDLINEPIAPAGEGQWESIALALINAIRAADTVHPIIFEPSPGGVPEAFEELKPLKADNVVYSVHFYEPYGFTHQGLRSSVSVPYPSPSDSPVGLVDHAALARLLAPVRQFADTYNLPLYVGEFSAVRWAPGTSAYNYVADAIDLFESYGWSWTYHEWRGYQGWDAELPETFFSGLPYVNAMPQGWSNMNFAAMRTNSTDTMLLLKQVFTLNVH